MQKKLNFQSNIPASTVVVKERELDESHFFPIRPTLLTRYHFMVMKTDFSPFRLVLFVMKALLSFEAYNFSDYSTERSVVIRKF